MDRRRRARRVCRRTPEAGQSALENAARDSGAAQRLRLGPVRSRAQASGRTGVGPGAVRPLANVVRQSKRAASQPAQALAAGIDGSWSQLLRQVAAAAKARSDFATAQARGARFGGARSRASM